MNHIQLEIVTPEKIAYSEEVDMVVVPSADGMLGILPHHIPLFSALVEGELKVKKGAEEYFLAIGGGFIEVTKEKVIILVTRAVNADELNEAEILRAKKEAEEALHRKGMQEDRVKAYASLRRSILDLKIISRKRRRTH